MELKDKAFELFEKGYSVAMVSRELNISYSKAERLKKKYLLLKRAKEVLGIA